ncbi:MAG: HEPN domain-containing protein [Spirochaetaceae bacterium]|nr:HEPN domain-containing protein [Spirochaetaceae bacterium]
MSDKNIDNNAPKVSNEVLEWERFAEMDYITANHLDKTLYPKPMEIICYHCQQCAEKYLKALTEYLGKEIEKTHDLGNLATTISESIEVPQNVLVSCAKLTQYGVKIRYPQEFEMSDSHVRAALADMENVRIWCKDKLNIKA